MQVKEIIEQAVGEIQHPADENMGDYSSNVAMKTGVDAEKVKEKLEKNKKLMEIIDRIEVVKPGFINFWLKKEWLIKEMGEVIKQADEYGKGNWGKNKRMLIDYSAPNIAKQFSVGHLRSTIIGQAIYNLFKFSGWQCVGDNHLGDWGTQFGMIIAAVEKWKLDLSEMNVDEIEKIYVKYNNLIKEDEKYLKIAQEGFNRLEKGEVKAKRIWQTAIEMSMKDFNRIYDLLGVRIDIANGESFYENLMPKVILEMKEKGVVSKGEGGALMVEFDNLPPAMLLKSDGSSTYFTRDMATVKYRRENPKLASDLYVYEVGAEQKLHFKQVFAAAEKMAWGKNDEFVHVAHGLVLGEDGKKMSTRKGTTESMEDLLRQMIKRAEQINGNSAKKVGVGAVIFNDLKHSPQTSYKFDWKKALSMEGDSGPYIQYSVVRGKSVINNAVKGSELSFTSLQTAESSEPFTDEMKILRKLYQFGEVVERATREFAPNLVCEYLLELSRNFNGFYGNNQIIGSENEEFRLALTAAVTQVLRNGLGLLNIEIPTKM